MAASHKDRLSRLVEVAEREPKAQAKQGRRGGGREGGRQFISN